MRGVALVSLLLATSALGASRARYGGTLRLATTEPALEWSPSVAERPAEFALANLRFGPLCRLRADGRFAPVLVKSLTLPTPTRLRIELWETLRAEAGSPLTGQRLLVGWNRLIQSRSASPYRALLHPLVANGRLAVVTRTATVLELDLAYPFPDLPRALCHPALAPTLAQGPRRVGIGPFISLKPGDYRANPQYPEGRPFVDALRLEVVDARGASRLMELSEADVALGVEHPTTVDGPALYAVYLGFRGDRVGARFRQDVEEAVDRTDLTRYFARPPSVPMRSLLPPSLAPAAPPPRSVQAQAPRAAPARDLQLLYDESVEDQRLVAERLQVKLHDRGYRVSLQGVPRKQLRARWASGDYELILHGVLMPPTPSSALALVLELSQSPQHLGQLEALGRIADDALRQARANEWAIELLPQLPLIPLYAQGLRWASSPRVVGLSPDAQGLPLFDQAFLVEP